VRRRKRANARGETFGAKDASGFRAFCADGAAARRDRRPCSDDAWPWRAAVRSSKLNPFDNGDAPKTRHPARPATGALGVNSYLWRATLDTLAFMPLASADPYGGVMITDWYVNPEKPDERFKATVYILDTRLRADGLNVTVFKQTRGADGSGSTPRLPTRPKADIENAILTRARQLRLSNING
jgi:hypothetical protein